MYHVNVPSMNKFKSCFLQFFGQMGFTWQCETQGSSNDIETSQLKKKKKKTLWNQYEREQLYNN